MTEPQQTIEAAPKKKRVNSKKKGSGFEGHISKILGEHLAPMMFRRSQSSGAILGGVNEKFMEHFSEDAKTLFIGDVVPTNEADVSRDQGWKLRFALECKFYKTAPNLDQLFNDPGFLAWFEQARTDAAKISKVPLLIFKYNRTEIFCAIDPSYLVAPSTVTKTLSLSNKPGECLTIFRLKEALLDLPWWKVVTQAETK